MILNIDNYVSISPVSVNSTSNSIVLSLNNSTPKYVTTFVFENNKVVAYATSENMISTGNLVIEHPSSSFTVMCFTLQNQRNRLLGKKYVGVYTRKVNNDNFIHVNGDRSFVPGSLLVQIPFDDSYYIISYTDAGTSAAQFGNMTIRKAP